MSSFSPSLQWWIDVALALLVLNSLSIILACFKSFWLWRMWKLLRHVRPSPPSVNAQDAEGSDGSDQLVTTFQVIRKVQR